MATQNTNTMLEHPRTTLSTKRLSTRTATQAPISNHKCRVIYLANGQERRSPWLYSEHRGKMALLLMQNKYGERSAILYRD